VTPAEADAFAEEWIAAWNSHEMERILAHYAEDVEVTSPFVVAVAGIPSGTLQGKAAAREYWSRALEQYPDLQFSLSAVFPGLHSLVLEYTSVRHLRAAECMYFDAADRVVRVVAHYREATA
jgi:hypothetical protein